MNEMPRTERPRTDAISRPALLLVAGRAIGFAASFAIPIVLVRMFDQAQFGTYKQLFLIYATLFGLAQLGMAESLYYFIPRNRENAGRYVCNALITLALVGTAGLALVYLARAGIAAWLNNAELAHHLPLLAVFLAIMLVSAGFEIIMISRGKHVTAACSYASCDIVRAALLILTAFAMWGLRGLLIGATVFAALRLAAMLTYVVSEFGRDLRIDARLWRAQLAYALPFALAVGIEVVQANFHQYFVASRFDAASFAIYAVGCLQIPLVDLIYTSTNSVMMVKMAEALAEGHERDALALWHDTTCKLASVMLPLAAFLLLMSREVIVSLFTTTYAASVPIFMVWCLMVLPAAFAVEAALRVYAQTRFLLAMNALRLTLIAVLIGWCLSTFGLPGAVLVTLLGSGLVKTLGIARIARLMKVGVGTVLPWGRLALIATCAVIAAVPVFWIRWSVSWPPLIVLLSAASAYAATYATAWYLSFHSVRFSVFGYRSSVRASVLELKTEN